MAACKAWFITPPVQAYALRDLLRDNTGLPLLYRVGPSGYEDNRQFLPIRRLFDCLGSTPLVDFFGLNGVFVEKVLIELSSKLLVETAEDLWGVGKLEQYEFPPG